MWRRVRHISFAIQTQERIYDIYLTESDEEAIVDFVKDQEELHNKTNNHLRARPGDIACLRGSQSAASCL